MMGGWTCGLGWRRSDGIFSNFFGMNVSDRS
jgi:hypothetical protein